MSVIDNVVFGLRRRGDKDAKAKAQEALELVELGHAGEQEADPALRRHAAARRAGPGPRQPAGRAAARRAARRPRPQAAPPDADRAQAHPAGGRADLHPRHPRPGGGHDHGRHHRGDERRPPRAARRPGHALRAPARRPSSRTSSASPTCCEPRSPAPPTAGLLTRRRARHSELAVVDASTCPRAVTDVWLGVRPEKLRPRARRRAATTCAASCTDVSFTGVATQYLVRMPWGQELIVVQQNDGSARATARRDRRPCRGTAAHEFVLDAAQSRRRGHRRGGRRWLSWPPSRRTGPPAPTPTGAAQLGAVRPARCRACSGWSSSSSLPMITLGSQSLQEGNVDDGYIFTGNVVDLRRRAAAVLAAAAALDRLRRPPPRSPRCCWPTRWRTTSPRRPGAGRTSCSCSSSPRSSPAS